MHPPIFFLYPKCRQAPTDPSLKGSSDMCDCNRDFIDCTRSITKNFALYGLQRRAAALERFDNELHENVDSGAHNLRRRVELMELRRKMAAVHHVLRKAKR
jgi:hypothetical protein